MADLSPSLTSASLCPFPQTGPPLPSIADADHRDLATDRNLDKMPSTGHLRGTGMHLGQLDLALAPQGNTHRRKFSSKARSSTSIKEAVIKDVGTVPVDPMTNFRPLFLFPLQQTMPARPSPASPAVLSR
jgi:hypothetical protein